MIQIKGDNKTSAVTLELGLLKFEIFIAISVALTLIVILGLTWILVKLLRKRKSRIKCEAFYCSEIQSQRFTTDKLFCLKISFGANLIFKRHMITGSTKKEYVMCHFWSIFIWQHCTCCTVSFFFYMLFLAQKFSGSKVLQYCFSYKIWTMKWELPPHEEYMLRIVPFIGTFSKYIK